MLFKFSLIFLLTAFSIGASAEKIVVGIPNKVVSLNPIESVTVQDRFILPLIYEYLVDVNAYGEINNRLIKAWDFDEKTRKLTFELVGDHKFSDGTLLRAVDVVAAFRELCKPGSKAVSQFVGLMGCGSKESELQAWSKGENSVVMRISIHPNAFLYQLAYGRGPIFKTDRTGRKIGSGTYALSEIENGNVKLGLNPFSKVKPALDEIEIRYVEEDQLREELKKHSIDLASMYLSSILKDLDLTDYKAVVHAPNVTQLLVLNSTYGPFREQGFRQTFREKLRHSGIERCKASSLANGLIPLGIPGSLNEVASFNEAHFTKAAKSTMTFYRHIGRKDECEEKAIQNVGRQMGLEIKFEYLSDYNQLMAKYKNPKTAGYVELVAFLSRDPSPFLSHLSPGSSDGIFFYSSPKIKADIDLALAKPAISERITIYQTINKEIESYAGLIPLYYVSHSTVIGNCWTLKSGNLENYNPNSFLFLADLQKQPNCPEPQ